MFVKGQSGNPGGRPRGAAEMARLIRKATNDGASLVKHAVKVWRDPKASERSRAWAHEWLTDRGFGRAVQSVDLNVGGEIEVSVPFADLTDEELRLLAKVDRKAEVKPTAGAKRKHRNKR